MASRSTKIPFVLILPHFTAEYIIPRFCH